MTYVVTSEAPNQTDKDKTEYKVELLAGETIVGITIGLLDAYETSQAASVAVSSKQNRRNLGEKLSIRFLLRAEANESGQVVFDHIHFEETSSSSPSSEKTGIA
jgi:hypothetical protein